MAKKKAVPTGEEVVASSAAAKPAAQAQGKMPTKSWTGAIEFGRIKIPILLYTAAREVKIDFHNYHIGCLSQIKQLGNFCPVCTGAPDLKSLDPKRRLEEVRLSEEEIFKGFEYSDGEIVPVSNEEIDSMKPESAKILTIVEFCKDAEVDPIYFESSFYCSPDTGGGRVFNVLREAMIAEGTVAIGKIVKSKRENLAIVRPYGDRGLMVYTAFMADEIRSMQFPDLLPAKANEVAVARQLISAMTNEWAPTQYTDSFRENVLALIEAKKGKTPLPKIEHKPVQSVGDDPFAAFTATLELVKAQKSKARKSA